MEVTRGNQWAFLMEMTQNSNGVDRSPEADINESGGALSLPLTGAHGVHVAGT